MCNVRRKKIDLIIWIVLFSMCLVFGGHFVASPIIASAQLRREIERNNMARFLFASEQYAPVIKDFLEQNREYFDLIQNGEVLEFGLGFRMSDLSYAIGIGLETDQLLYLYKPEWLSAEEMNALIHLASNQWWVNVETFNDNRFLVFWPCMCCISRLNSISRETYAGLAGIFVKYNPNMVQMPTIERHELLQQYSYRYIYREHLADAYFLRIERNVYVPRGFNPFLQGILGGITLLFGLIFIGEGFISLKELRNAKKQAEDSDKIE